MEHHTPPLAGCGVLEDMLTCFYKTRGGLERGSTVMVVVVGRGGWRSFDRRPRPYKASLSLYSSSVPMSHDWWTLPIRRVACAPRVPRSADTVS